jgi:hypothetical protein
MNIIHNFPLSTLLHGLAYLDPGSGSFILQILLASFLGALFVVRTYWQKILAFFRGSPSEDSLDAPTPAEDEQVE